MSVWVLHLPEGRLPPREEIAKGGEGMLRLPFDEWPDATGMNSPGELRQKLKALHPESTPEAVARMGERLWVYAHGIHAEDIIAIPEPSRAEVVFAMALARPAYKNGYVLRVRWLGNAARIAGFGKYKQLFEHFGPPLAEVTSAPARAAIRDRLALPGNRWRRWKWLLVVLMGLQLMRMALRMVHQEGIGF